MTKKKNLPVRQAGTTTFDEHLTTRYGKSGTLKRTEFEIKAKAFLINAFSCFSLHSTNVKR